MNRISLCLVLLVAGSSISGAELTVEKAADLLEHSISRGERMGALTFLRRHKEEAAPAVRPLARILAIGPNSTEARWAWQTLAGTGPASVDVIGQVAGSGFDSAYLAGWIIRRYPPELEERLLPLLAGVEIRDRMVALRSFNLSPEAANVFFKDAFNNGGYLSRLWPSLMVGHRANDHRILEGIRKHPWVMMKYVALRLEEEWHRRDSPEFQRFRRGPKPAAGPGPGLPKAEAERGVRKEAALRELAEASMGQAMEQFRRAHGDDSKFLHLMFVQYLSKHTEVPEEEMIELIDLCGRDPGTRLDLLLLDYRKELVTELRKKQREIPRAEVQTFATLHDALAWLDERIEARDIEGLIDIQARLTHLRPTHRVFIHKLLRERPHEKLADMVAEEDLPDGAEEFQLGGRDSALGPTRILFMKEEGRWRVDRIHPFN